MPQAVGPGSWALPGDSSIDGGWDTGAWGTWEIWSPAAEVAVPSQPHHRLPQLGCALDGARMLLGCGAVLLHT